MDDVLRTALVNDGYVEFTVRVHPGAKKTCARERMADGVWKIDIAAVPEEGAANESLRRFVAAEFGVPVARVEIVSGHTSRRKRLRITAQR